MTNQPDITRQADTFQGISFDPRLVDAVIVNAGIHAPQAILAIDRPIAMKALYSAATGRDLDGLDWIIEAGRVVWENRNVFLGSDDIQP